MDAPIDLNIGSDFEFILTLTKRLTGTATTRTPATGLTGVTGRLSLTPTGAAIGTSTAALAEDGVTGIYTGVLDSTTLTTDLTASLGRLVYAICSKAGDIQGEYQIYRVVDRRMMPLAS